MAQTEPQYQPMSLYRGVNGERKYLNRAERKRFYHAVAALPDPRDQTFALMIYWTGCRPSEALALTAGHIDLDDAVVVIRSLKKRGGLKGRHFRTVPLERKFVERLEAVHDIRAAQRGEGEGSGAMLWTFSGTTGWRRVNQVMLAAGLSGAKACARGLRHSFGALAAVVQVPETRIQYWLGHSDLATTAIYLDLAIAEDRCIARRMWPP